MTDKRHRYFAYGSNMDPVQMEQRCPGAQPIGPAALCDHRLAYTFDAPSWEGGVATVIPSEGSDVWGVLWLLTDAHLETLDEYEGVALGIYRRERIEVVAGAEKLQAEIYLTNDTAPHLPHARYIEALARGAEHFGLPAAYVAELRRTPTA